MVADPGGDDPDPNSGPAVKKKKLNPDVILEKQTDPDPTYFFAIKAKINDKFSGKFQS